MGDLTFILGGARSGKSSHAELLAQQHDGSVTFIATGQALDEEMASRIERHRAARLETWRTLELPLVVGRSLKLELPKTDLILVDCLTLLVSNILMQAVNPDGLIDEPDACRYVEEEISELLEVIDLTRGEWIVVSNEVGMGLVPPYPLGRIYRDLLGKANQRLAARADQVIFMIAGIPMRLAPQQARF